MTTINGIPRTGGSDSTVDFLHQGYLFGLHQFTDMGTDAFRTRLRLRPVTVIRGRDAARIFYEGGRFSRDRTMPAAALHLLQDKRRERAVDGGSDLRGKQMYARLLSDDTAIGDLQRFFSEEWARATARWDDRAVLAEEVPTILTRTALRWSGVDPGRVDVPARRDEFLSLLDQAGTLSPSTWLSVARRRRTEAWAMDLLRQVRQGKLSVDDNSIVKTLAHYRSPDGHLLGLHSAAVELDNVVRPIVAIGRFVAFEALAWQRHPRARDALVDATVDSPATHNFVSEVRRFYPSYPAIGGSVLREFEWHGHNFQQGEWVLFDLYATNHDPALWGDPERFRPGRFESWEGDPNTLVLQDVGARAASADPIPGERATIAVMAAAVPLLRDVFGEFRVPEQDLRVSLNTFPAEPESGFVVQRQAASSAPRGRHVPLTSSFDSAA